MFAAVADVGAVVTLVFAHRMLKADHLLRGGDKCAQK